MGIFDFLFGSSQGSQGSSTTTTSLPPWLQEHLQGIASRGRDLSLEPYPQYGGPRVAGLTPDQEASFARTRQAAGAYEGDINAARAGIAGIPREFTADYARQYMNPYTQTALQDSLGEINRQADIQERGIQDELIRTGNFGGSRAGIRLGEHDRNTATLRNQFINQANVQNFQQAQAQFNADRNAQAALAQQRAGIGGLAQQYGLTGAQGLAASGQAQQAQQQTSLDTAYQDFLRQQQYPYQQLGYYSNILQGVPSPVSQFTQTQQPQASPLAQIAGLGVAGLGAYNLFGR